MELTDIIIIGAVLSLVLKIFFDLRQMKTAGTFKSLRSQLKNDPYIDKYFPDLVVKYSVLYPLLNDIQKKVFRDRVISFIRNKEFTAAGDLLEVTDEMKVLTSIVITQLTFGHPEENLDMFSRIILFPDEFQFGRTERYLKGEVNLTGGILLSWKNLLEGIADKEDGTNLALHEAAHAFRLSIAFGMVENSEILTRMLHEFDDLASDEMQKFEEGSHIFFREYGAQNYNEFFAVAVECYFEQPGQFIEYNPLLYNKLREILHIDLLRSDPVITEKQVE